MSHAHTRALRHTTHTVTLSHNVYTHLYLQGVQHQLETVSAEMQADKAAWAEERTQLQV